MGNNTMLLTRNGNEFINIFDFLYSLSSILAQLFFFLSTFLHISEKFFDININLNVKSQFQSTLLIF